LTCILYYSTTIPTYQSQLRDLNEWPVENKYKYRAFQHSVCYGHLNAIKYLVKTFQLTSEDARSHDNFALRLASQNGYLKVLKYLVQRFQLTSEDARSDNNYAFRWASYNGHLKVLKYLVETFQLTSKDARAEYHFAIHYASSNGYYDVVHYLKSLK
jgi:hypothetical protein